MRRDELTRLVEQSALGALMLVPGELTTVRQWLRPNDFADLWHAQVYTALLERHLVGGLDPNSMAAVLVERLGTRGADLPRFTQLLAATPPRPSPADYARMVADGGLRREIAGLGILLQAAALNSVCDRSSTPLSVTCSLVDAGLESAGARWAQANGLPHDDVVVPLHLRAAARNTGLEARTAADRYLTTHPARDPEDESAHVVDLVGTLIAQPAAVASVEGWLPASRIEDPGWREIYAATVELAELGRQVDLATVAWAACAHAHHGPELPSMGALRATVEAGRFAYAPAVIGAVAGDQARNLADVGSQHLRTAAANPAALVGDIVDAGHTIVTALRTVTHALPDRDAATEIAQRPSTPARDLGGAVSR